MAIESTQPRSIALEFSNTALASRHAAPTEGSRSRTVGNALTQEARDAILSGLYEEVAAVRRGLDEATGMAGDQEYLEDLLSYIDELEAPELASPHFDSAVARLEALNANLLTLRAKIATERR